MLEKLTNAFKELVGERHEVTDSIREALEERLSSPFYGYFILSWTLVNWDYLYAAFFLSGDTIFEKTGLLKNEYLLQTVLPEHYGSFLYWWNFLLLPFIITIIAFWLMPFVTRIFFKKHIRNQIKMEEIRAEEMVAGAEAEKTVLEAETKVLEAEVEQARAKEEVTKVNPSVLWKKEYGAFKSGKLYKKFEELIEHFYEHNGFISYNNPHGFGEITLDKDILVFADVNGLINIDGNEFEFTEKGKTFVKYYSNDKQSLI